MKIQDFSDNGLKAMHRAVQKALSADDHQPGPEKLYGVRQYSDWREWSDALEAELTRRGLTFVPVSW